jgi:hypothetical protein
MKYSMGGPTRKRTASLLFLAALAAAFSLCSLAVADATPTQPEYVAHLEGICKPHALATQRTMKGIKPLVRAEHFAPAAAKFSRATNLFDTTVREISVVPRPPTDAARLAKWFVYLGRQQSLLKTITAELRAGHAIAVQRLTARFIKNGNAANNEVIALGFNYCRFKLSRYE